MASEEAIVFKLGSERLVGILHDVPGASTGLLFVAGGGQYRVGSHRLYVQMARELAASGFPVFRFDHRGAGDSDGQFRGFEHITDDITAAVSTFTRLRPAVRRIVLVGLCDGASAAAMSSNCRPEVSALILINPWVHSGALEARTRFSVYYGDRLRSKEFWTKAFTGQLEIGSSARSFFHYLKVAAMNTFGRMQADDSAHFVRKMKDRLISFGGRTLVVLSGRDLVAQEFKKLQSDDVEWRVLGEQTSLDTLELSSADHTFSSGADRRQVVQHLVTWLMSDVSETRK